MSFCNAKCPEECAYGILSFPESLPIKTVEDLSVENVRLKKEVEYWREKAQSNWDIVESVALGEKLPCAKCGDNHPCQCDK